MLHLFFFKSAAIEGNQSEMEIIICNYQFGYSFACTVTEHCEYVCHYAISTWYIHAILFKSKLYINSFGMHAAETNSLEQITIIVKHNKAIFFSLHFIQMKILLIQAMQSDMWGVIICTFAVVVLLSICIMRFNFNDLFLFLLFFFSLWF